MKTTYPYMPLAVLLIMRASCNSDPTYYTLPEQPDDMHIQVSDTVLVLSKAQELDTAVTFTWSPVKSPIEKYDSITYSLRIYNTADKANSQTEFMNVGTQTSKSFTTDELNTIIGRWATPGETLNLTAEVTGTVNNEVKYIKPEKSTVSFTVTGYEKFPANLFMHITNEDGTTSVVRLSQKNTGSGIYEASTNMHPCSYYFTTSASSDYPAYGLDHDSIMTYVTEGTIPQFSNDQEGQRTIVVDTNNDYFDCHVYNVVVLPNGFMHIVGNGCSVGWDLSSSEANFVQEDARHPYLWSWTGQFTAGGEIKIALGTSWGDYFFYAPVDKADPLKDHRLSNYRYQSDGGDLKWVPTVSGKYKFTCCLLSGNMWTAFEPAK